jgi:hypothetical protein
MKGGMWDEKKGGCRLDFTEDEITGLITAIGTNPWLRSFVQMLIKGSGFVYVSQADYKAIKVLASQAKIPFQEDGKP